MASNWRQKHRQELRKALYETALELFETQGYERTTVQQITSRVNVAKGTFFNHFPTKEHIVEEWYNQITVDSLKAARERSSVSSEEAICDLCADMAKRATKSPELLIAKSQNSSNPLLLEAEQAQDDAVGAFFLERLESGKERGELAEDLDVSLFVELLRVVLTGSSRVWFRTHPRPDFPTVLRERIHFLFRAAKAPRD